MQKGSLEQDLNSITIDPTLRSMVAFDIETMGLNPLKERITAAAVYSGDGLCKVFVFKDEDRGADEALKGEFIAILDAAPRSRRGGTRNAWPAC